MVMKMNNQERLAHLKAEDYQKYFGVKKQTYDVMHQILEKDYQRKHRILSDKQLLTLSYDLVTKFTKHYSQGRYDMKRNVKMDGRNSKVFSTI